MEEKKPVTKKPELINGKPKVITEKIPDNLLAKITEARQKKQLSLNHLIQITINILNAQVEQREIMLDLKSAKKAIAKNLTQAHKKMRLGKDKDYQWKFDNRDSFIGIYNPPKPKPSVGIKGLSIPPIAGRGEKPETNKPKI